MVPERISRTRIRFQRVLRITVAWAVLACLTALFEHTFLLTHGSPGRLMDRIDDRLPTAIIAGLLGGTLYLFVLRDRWRRLPYFHAVGLMAILLAVVLVVVRLILPPTTAGSGDLLHQAFSYTGVSTFLYWFLLMAGTMLMVRLNDQLGSGGISYLTGFYHKPRQEMRIFMFLDMRSSTAIAERLGHTRYFELLNELFADITDPILYSRGDIYQYVGDEISVSWSFRRGVGRQRCIRCFLDIRRKLRARAAHYEARYGLTPVFKAGFHYGPVTTGEVGLVKKERIYSGDVVNTAAHIQNQCNKHGVDNLISDDLVKVLRLPASYTLRGIGSTELKGRSQAIGLWTLEEKGAAAQ